MSYVNLASPRPALRRRHAAMQGLGNPYALGGAISALLTMCYWYIKVAMELDEEREKNKIPACEVDGPKYNFEKCQQFRAAKESASALTSGGVINNDNAQRAVDILRSAGVDMSGIDTSFLDTSFSFSMDELMGALSSIPTSARPGNISDSQIAAILGGSSSDVYDAPPPVDGPAAAVENASPTKVALVVLVVLGLGYAAYKHL